MNSIQNINYQPVATNPIKHSVSEESSSEASLWDYLPSTSTMTKVASAAGFALVAISIFSQFGAQENSLCNLSKEELKAKSDEAWEELKQGFTKITTQVRVGLNDLCKQSEGTRTKLWNESQELWTKIKNSETVQFIQSVVDGIIQDLVLLLKDLQLKIQAWCAKSL